MKCIVLYYEMAKKCIIETSKRPDRINYAFLKSQTGAQLNKLSKMKFQKPSLSKPELKAYFVDFS